MWVMVVVGTMMTAMAECLHVIGYVRARVNLTIAQICAYIYSDTSLDLTSNDIPVLQGGL